jgi:hypothetical protein
MNYDLIESDKKRLLRFQYGNDIIFDCNSFGWTGDGDMKIFPDYDTPQDAHDLAKKLVEMGKWEKFWYDQFYRPEIDKSSTCAAWLFAEPESPARFCWLVAKFMEEEDQ